MKECLVFEINIYNEQCFFNYLYRPPSQSHEELESFCFNLDLPFSNINDQHPSCSITICDFIAKSSKSQLLTKITEHALNCTVLQKQQVKWSAKYQICKKTVEVNCWFMKNFIATYIIYSALNFNVTLPPPYYKNVWDYKHKILKALKKLFQNLPVLWLSSIKM